MMMANPMYTPERRNIRMQFSLYIVLSIISAALQIKGIALCPNTCTCSDSSNRVAVTCSRRGLASIPSEFPSDSYTINLQLNDITIVETGSFNNYSVLDTIYINFCKISVIQPGAFVILPKLRLLYLNGNNISTISSETFVGLGNLFQIHLDQSKVKRIEQAAFKDLVKLEYLYLSENDISDIDSNYFENLPSLRYLYLQDNEISQVSVTTFAGMLRLYEINLGYNIIRTLTTGTFVGFGYLSTINLQHNRLNKIEDGAIEDLQNLYYMYLQHNDISVIDNTTFSYLPRLDILYLQHNDISVIDNTTFSYLPRLDILDLGSNRIAEIQPSSFTNLTNLGILKLTNNSISDVKQDYFNGVSYLSEIWLDKNNVTYIEDGVFQNMPFLRVLALNLYCDCSIIPFWNWLNIVGKHESTITCFERNGAFLPSLPSCAFDKCNGTVCPDNFCTNGGTCFVNSFGDPTCLCPGDWTGAKCNVHPCHNNPCGLNGLCEIDGYQTATCQCYGNWTGQFCERSPCHTQVCSQSMCYYNDTGASICLNLHDSECTENTTTEEPLTTPYVYETSKEQTTEPSTTKRKSTTPLTVPSTARLTSPAATPSPTPCIGGGLNRTNAILDEECGTHGEDAKCNVPNSACTETSIASTWRCRCVQGYAKNNTSCLKLPSKLFSQESRKWSIDLPESGPIGQQVLRVNFTEVDGFHKLLPTAEMMGSDSDNFSLTTANTENVVVTRRSAQLSKLKYDIFVVVSVTIDGIVIRDFIHLAITVTRTKIIEQNIFVIDGTPANSVVGLVCQSCLSGDFISINPDNVVSVKNDGSIQTSRHITLDTLQSTQTIAYSSYVQVKQNNHLVANITIIIVRLQYNISLTEDSKQNTIVGYLKLSIPFSINKTKFELNDQSSLTLGSVSLDYLTEQEVQKTFVLIVNDGAFVVTTIIKVQDVNNNAPMFLETSYRFVTVQSAYTDLTIGVVTAVDHDTHTDLTYSINPNDKLSINKNGVISVHNKFSPNALDYSATVTVNDGIFPASVNVTIDIRPATDKNKNQTFSGTIAENIDTPTNITTVKIDGYENFKFTDQSANKDFIIESQTGIIQNARAFDRENEKEREFKYTVVANKENEATCSLAIIGEVTITVTDVNDEPPEFVCVHYKASVEEGEAGKELLLVPGLSTTDKDYISTVVYSLKTHGDKFNIDQDKGSIKTIAALDRETHESFDIIVNAYDGVHNSNTTITVHIIDVNDNNPSIEDPKSFISRENASVGTSVGFIVATDIDEGPNAMITFDLVSDGGYFRINQTTGNIIVSRQLDRETIEIHYVTVYARDNGNNIRHTSATVTVTIDDVNDNAPVFDQDQDSFEFEEHRPCSNPITVINASDADKVDTPNSQIRYSVTRGAEYFTVDQISGILECKVPLDYEKNIFYEITIEARDNGSPVMSSVQTVIIKVGDINDNSPQFVDIKPQIIIRYFSPGRVVAVFKATDMDSGENGLVHFSLSGDATEFLQIDKLDGIVRTKKTDSDRPTKNRYFLNVTATDNGIPPRASTNSLEVRLEQQAEPSIEFKQQVINMTITENSAQNSSLESVSKYVKKNEDKSVTFDIIDERADISFSLDEYDGMVTLKKTIDREIKEVHEFVVRVKSNNDDDGSDMALVRVKIIDKNDNPPLFGVAEYFFIINEKEDEGAPVSPHERKIIATDADIGENAIVKYTLHSEGGLLPFSLKDEGNGIMSVQLSTKVDYEEHKQYRFSVEAFNPNNRKMNSTTPIVIDIQDYNDNYPEFHGHNKSVYTVFVREDTSINTNLKSFGKLIDKDSRENGAIDLTIVNGDVCLFTVNRVDEELFLKIKLANITLDYEKGPQHNTCIIKATDRGVNKLSSTATLSISITDVNDNAPHINNPDIIKNLSRDAVSKTVVVDSIPATDIDSGENGMILYRIALSAHSSRFIIDPATGNITVNTPLLSVQKDEIQLTVIVSDKGVPSLSATAQVTIRLQDDNPRPYFEKSENVTIQEHTPILNGILAKIKAYDRRDGVISVCDCLYLLDTDRNDIIIENDTGVIKFIHSDYTLDREEEIRGHIIIGVIAIDKGEPPKESPTMEFKIIIKDINDQVPVFTKIHYTFEIFQHAPNGFNIGKVVAVDLDENPETLYSINITESSVGSVVEIDNSTGKIVKSGNMSLSSAQNVQMKGNVFAQDGKDLKKSRSHAEITITIEFDDKNNHTPVFEKSEYNAAIDWNLAAGYKIVDVVAEDADVGKEGNITYSIIDGNTRGFFSINSSGAVLLKYQLDSSIGDNSTVIVELIVKAEDKGIIPKNSNASVIIRISGKNPGTCIQGAEHSKQLLNIESERDNWSYALYGLVGALCLAILMSFAFLYKWRTSPVSETTPPVGKMKYFDNPIPYDHLRKRETVEYSHSNESFDPPSRNCDFSDDKDQYQRVTEPEGEARYRRPLDNKHLHSSRPLSFEEPTPDYPVYEFEGKVTKPTIPSTSRTSENC